MKAFCLKSTFKKRNFIYFPLEESPSQNSYLLKFNLQSYSLDLLVEQSINPHKDIFIYAVFPLKVPKGKRKDMAVFTTLLNNNLTKGCWELDMSDGSLRFRISYLYQNNSTELETHLVKNIDYALTYSELCSNAIFKLMYADRNPFELYQELTKKVDVSLN